MPRYSIITPSLLRPTLRRTCDSISAQSNPSWQHVIIADGPAQECAKLVPPDDRRKLLFCGTRHNDFGNTCRYNAWEHAEGEFCFYIDDDDYLADADVLTTLEQVTEPWAIFPVLWHGQHFFNVPPGINRTGSAMFIARREIGRWLPNRKEYAADGALVEHLIANYPYQTLKDVRPLAVLPESHYGK
jgi:glycosyltransferase involved in cell wall biosynthesis